MTFRLLADPAQQLCHRPPPSQNIVPLYYASMCRCITWRSFVVLEIRRESFSFPLIEPFDWVSASRVPAQTQARDPWLMELWSVVPAA